ncbi:YncE family protein [Williamsia sp. MIQD14]|uniref:YncE family protein n=1 Tax=Williamsia sp. MIQD14 TaxID=3425703 RepID=UPI003D9FCAFF
MHGLDENGPIETTVGHRDTGRDEIGNDRSGPIITRGTAHLPTRLDPVPQLFVPGIPLDPVVPTAPVPATPRWKTSLRRRVFHTAAPPTGDTGVRRVTGRVSVVDPASAGAGDTAWRHVLESAPQHGRVTVRPDGSFDYVPGMAVHRLSRTAGPVADRFRVAVSDDAGRRHTLAVTPIVSADAARTPVRFCANATGSASIDLAATPRTTALDASGTRLYVISSEASSATVIDTVTSAVVGVVDLPGVPTALCVDPSGARLFIALTDDDTIAVVDTASATVMGGVRVSAPVAVGVSPDGASLIVAGADGSLRVLDAAGDEVGRVDGLGRIRSVLTSDDGLRAYVLDESGPDAIVHVVALGDIALGDAVSAPRKVGAIRTDGFVHDMALGANDTRLHLVSTGARTLITVDTRTLMVVSVIDLGGFHTGVAAAPDGNTVYVSASFGDAVSAVDLRTGAVVAAAPTGEFPRHLVCSPDGARVYAATADAVTVLTRSVPGAIVGPDDGIGRIYTVVGGPRHGSVRIDADGRFVYTSDLPFVENDEFRVLVDDGLRTAGTAVISVCATPPVQV